MRFAQQIAAELRKARTLPATYVAVAVAAVGPVVIAVLNAFAVRNALNSGRSEQVGYSSAAEVMFSGIPFGTAGAVILGVVAISSEYTANSTDAGGGRQISTTLTATPRRWPVLLAKAVVVVVLVAAAAAIAIPASFGVADVIVGNAGPGASRGEDLVARSFGAGVYWVLAALLALAITVLTRSGIVPLIVLIANGTFVSFSLLLTKVTPVARYLPDLAGIRLFAGEAFIAVDDAPAPLTGGLVMAAWAVGLLAVAGLVLSRRDA